ncbi:MAG: glycyl radical protein [Candidatus Cloacimonetes bacterium]|nr:glycyl radical protein [Candidatus Cloacimonadota bacterium]
MNERIKRLRDLSINAINRISVERAELITDYYSQPGIAEKPVAVQRAQALQYFLRYKKLYYERGELIIGERGEAPKATSTYPEITLHSLKDLKILHNREKVSFNVSEEVSAVYSEKIIPFWQGQTNRDRLFANLDDDWKAAYKAGIFTEFQEQRAPGHTVLGHKLFQKGFLQIILEIEEVISKLSKDDPGYQEKQDELTGMKIAANAIIEFAQRNAEFLDELSLSPAYNEETQIEMKQIADICRKVPAQAPQTFQEALQHYWFIHLGVVSELNPWDSFNPGRLDQHLYPFYQKSIADGTLTGGKAIELLESFWIKFNNHPSPPKIGVTAQESNTYTDFCLINLGGLTPDGSDGVNELSYLILDVIEEMRLLQPSSMVQISSKSPDEFLIRALKIIKTGFGQPSIFNTDAIIQELINQGKELEDARRGGASGCVETGAFGTEAYILTGYFNLPKILELSLNNGFDPVSKQQLGPQTGKDFQSFQEILNAYKAQLEYFIAIKIKGNNIIHALNARYLKAPFLSLLIDGCIASGTDYNAGGAKYNTTYIQGVGLGTITDSLSSIRHHVFDLKDITFNKLMEALKADYEGYEEIQYIMKEKIPRWGNDDNRADEMAGKVFDYFFQAVDGKPTSIGGVHRINLLPTTCHVYFGSKTGALPEGRNASTPLSEGISPVQGCDRKGPTAVLNSMLKIDHLKTGGTLLNQKFTPDFFENNNSLKNLCALVRCYFAGNGHHIQFNVVDAETLRDAQINPQDHKNLIVRVAGYSDYFNDLGKDLQDEIINRTTHN